MTLEQAEQAIRDCSELFAASGDKRGIFPTAYARITNRTLHFIDALEDKEQAAKARRLATHFAQLYFEGLRDHLTGQDENSPWKAYYEMARDPKIDGLQVFLAGANAHLVRDLPWSIVASGMEGEKDRELYLQWGQALSDSTSAMVGALEYKFDMKARAMEVSTTAREIIFGTLRGPAWNRAMAYRKTARTSPDKASLQMKRSTNFAHSHVGDVLWLSQPVIGLAQSAGEANLKLEEPKSWLPALGHIADQALKVYL